MRVISYIHYCAHGNCIIASISIKFEKEKLPTDQCWLLIFFKHHIIKLIDKVVRHTEIHRDTFLSTMLFFCRRTSEIFYSHKRKTIKKPENRKPVIIQITGRVNKKKNIMAVSIFNWFCFFFLLDFNKN